MLLEKTVLKFIQTKFRGRIGDAVMPAISALGNAGAVWLLLGAAYVCVPEGRRLGAALFAALALELFLCNVLLKPLVGRARPFQSDGSVALLVSSPGDFSFPSGHTGASFAAAAVMFFRAQQPVGLGAGAGGTYRLFEAVSLCALSFRRFGRRPAWHFNGVAHVAAVGLPGCGSLLSEKGLFPPVCSKKSLRPLLRLQTFFVAQREAQTPAF